MLKKHRAALLGPLDGVLAAELEFKRGFLSSARLKGGTSNALKLAISRSVGEPMWATVEHLSGADGELVMHEVMRSLTSLEECDAPLEALGRLPRLAALRGARVSEEKHVAALTAPGAFPALRRLHARGYPWALAKVVLWPRAKTLDSLGLEVHASSPLGDEHHGLLKRALALSLIPLAGIGLFATMPTPRSITSVHDCCGQLGRRLRWAKRVLVLVPKTLVRR